MTEDELTTLLREALTPDPGAEVRSRTELARRRNEELAWSCVHDALRIARRQVGTVLAHSHRYIPQTNRATWSVAL